MYKSKDTYNSRLFWHILIQLLFECLWYHSTHIRKVF